jgi:hypothetical protein
MDKPNQPSNNDKNNNDNKSASSFQLGMSSFNAADREQFGQRVRLAMACIEGKPECSKNDECTEQTERTEGEEHNESINRSALPQDAQSIRERLKLLSQEISSQHADLLELLVRFDDQQAWKQSGANHCAAWMNAEIGISTKLSWEYLRVGRQLQSLPTLRALFRVGKLSWSKVRLITRVADGHNEKILCHAALDASVSEVKRLCDGYRWCDKDGDDGENAENTRTMQQWNSRSFTWREASNGSTQIQLVLPPELAQAFLNSVEHCLGELGASDNTMSQRRADAAVLMAESSLQGAGKAIATADRYQVSVSVDESELALIKNSCNTHSINPDHLFTDQNPVIPAKRPTIAGAGPIGRETARRIACDCSISVNKTKNGEPIDIGRKSRIWPSAMARAIKERDQQCVWPGCDHSRHLHIHHMQHWADGGATSVENGVCLCSYHHTLVHEGGYKIEAVAQDKDGMHKQFFQQLNFQDLNQFDFEESLRNDRESFNTIRQLSPERFRFRIIDKNGYDIADAAVVDTCSAQNTHDASTHIESTRTESTHIDSTQNDSTRINSKKLFGPTQIDPNCHSTHWQCKEPPPAMYCT